MGPIEYIAIVSLILLYGGLMIGFWVKINVKLKELEIMVRNNYKQFKDHQNCVDRESIRLDKRIDTLLEENKVEHKEILIKMDNLLEGFNDFKVYVTGKL